MQCELTKLNDRESLINTIANRDDLLVFVFNINYFKETNMRYGDHTGNLLLVYVAEKMKEFFDDDYKLFRLYGATFAVITYSYNYTKKIKNVETFLKEIEKQTHKLEENDYQVQLTCGAAMGVHAFYHAEDALDEAKKEQKQIVVNLKNTTCEVNLFDEYEEIERVKRAIVKDAIIPHFQGILNLKTNKIEKYECLARLVDGDKVISPFFFIKAAKKARLYEKVTLSIIKKSFETFKDLDYEFSINLDYSDLKSDEVKNFFLQQLKKYEGIGNRVIIEIVEVEDLIDSKYFSEFFDEVKKYGVKLAIDDFGTGYSSFATLVQIEANILKIDGSLIKNINDNTMFNTVKAIAEYAKTMGAVTVAEFVENKSILQKVKEAGIDYGQGYEISKPLPLPNL